MARTTFEEAKVCDSCGEPGEEGGKTFIRPTRFGPPVSVTQILCRNIRCVEYNKVCKLIQIGADGSIPEPSMDRIGKYAPLEGNLEHRRKLIVDNIQDELARGEIRRR
jgi:hypothetical protein